MYTALAVALTVLLQLPPPAPAPAVPDARAKPRAQALLKEGSRLYRGKQFQAALDRFAEAYRLYPSPKLQFNIAQANRDLGRPVDALLAFDAFLAHAQAADAPATAVAEARASVEDLRAQLGRIQVQVAQAGLEVFVDGDPVGRTPLPAPLWVTAGTHEVTMRGAGVVAQNQGVSVPAGGMRSVQLTARPLALALAPRPPGASDASLAVPEAPAEDPPRAGQWYRRWWVWALAGSAVAIGGGALVVSRGSGTPMPSTSLGTQKVFP